MSAAAVDTPVVDPNVAAQGQTPPVVSTLAEPKATPTERLETFVKDMIPEYRKAQPKAQEETQSDDDKVFKDQQEKRKKEIDDKIKKIIEDADEKYKALSKLYKDAKAKYNIERSEENYAELNEISASIDAVYYEKSEALDKIQEDLDGDTTPIFVKGVQSLFNFALNKIQAIFKKSQLANNALIISEDTMDNLENISKKINEEIKEGEKANLQYLKELVDFANEIAVPNTSAPTSSSGPGSLDKAAAAVTGTDPAAAAAKALTGAAGADSAAAEAAAKALGGTAAAAAGAAGAVEEKGDELLPDPTEKQGDGQGGGGISRKRSDPKYINQISENRNKIFKKELEIINSIRRFHRSHTIRKRDKINSILGFKKSRNNRNRNHDGNTKRHRHQHRHNNHKHKSAKHIKK
jgi:hypothetical protein